MSVVIAGVFRAPPENLPALAPHMAAVIAASRAEAGCEAYSYAQDLLEPGLIRVFELWRDQAAVEAHFRTPHMAAWQKVRAELGVHGREIAAYEVAATRRL